MCFPCLHTQTWTPPLTPLAGFTTKPDVSWDDVGSLTEVREELSFSISQPIAHPERFEAMGLRAATGGGGGRQGVAAGVAALLCCEPWQQLSRIPGWGVCWQAGMCAATHMCVIAHYVMRPSGLPGCPGPACLPACCTA